MVALSVVAQVVDKYCPAKLDVTIFKPASLSSVALFHLYANSWSLVSTSASNSITFWMASSLFSSTDNVQKLHLLHRKATCACRCVLLPISFCRGGCYQCKYEQFSESKLKAILEKNPGLFNRKRLDLLECLVGWCLVSQLGNSWATESPLDT